MYPTTTYLLLVMPSRAKKKRSFTVSLRGAIGYRPSCAATCYVSPAPSLLFLVAPIPESSIFEMLSLGPSHY